MTKSTDIRIKRAECETEFHKYRAPAKFGGRVVSEVVLLNVAVAVETRDGRRGVGKGSMPLGNIWAWPSQKMTPEQTLGVMLDFGQRCVVSAAGGDSAGHPLDLTRELEHDHLTLAKAAEEEARAAEPMPRLAHLVAASALEAAIHDANGKALGQNSYNLLGPEYVSADLSTYLTREFAGEYLDRYTQVKPKATLPLYHLVGALDPLTDGDISNRLNDGLPETLAEWIAADGLTHLKIKLAGDDFAWDLERILAVDRVAENANATCGGRRWYYSADFNERCQSVEYLLDLLAKLREQAPATFDRLQYIEQPTHRDLEANRGNKMHRAAEIKPVVIDESLVDLHSLQTARELGYSGVALKACKGQTGALLMAAAAQKYGMFLCVQDLTCPGASFLHSASLAARIPGVAAIEGNARQYCPAANAGWRERYPGVFHVKNGEIETGGLDGPGLGF